MRIFDDLNRRFSAFNGFASKIEAASSHPWLRLHFPPPAGRAMQGAPQPYLFTVHYTLFSDSVHSGAAGVLPFLLHACDSALEKQGGLWYNIIDTEKKADY